jgi:hypothetical protein
MNLQGLRGQYLVETYGLLIYGFRNDGLKHAYAELEGLLLGRTGEMILAAHTPWEDFMYRNFPKENALHKGDQKYGAYQERFIVGILQSSALIFEETERGVRCRLPATNWAHPEGRTVYVLPGYEDVPFPAVPKIILREKSKSALGIYEKLLPDMASVLVVGNEKSEEWLHKHRPKAKFTELFARCTGKTI